MAARIKAAAKHKIFLIIYSYFTFFEGAKVHILTTPQTKTPQNKDKSSRPYVQKGLKFKEKQKRNII